MSAKKTRLILILGAIVLFVLLFISPRQKSNSEPEIGVAKTKVNVSNKNEALDVCIYWDVPNPLSPGLYIVELYLEEVQIGRTSYELK